MLAGRKNEPPSKGTVAKGIAATESYRLKPPQKRLLEVEVIEARDIMTVKKAAADTYVQGCLIDLGGREIKKECFNTKVQKDTTSPQWNEKFLFGHVYNLNTVGDLPTLNLTVFHKAPFSVAEQPLGMVQIHLEHLDTSGFQLDTWFELQKVGRMEKVTGKLHLAIKFNSPPTTGDVEMGDSSALDDVEDSKEEGKGDGIDVEPNELVVTVLRGRKLLGISRDLLSSSRPAYSSPYVKLQLGSDQHKTKHILRNLSPTWKEQVVFKPATDPSLTLQLTVKDHESMLDGFMGRIALPLSQFTDKKAVTKWHKLKNKKCEEDGIDRGEVELKVHWRYSTIVQQEISDNKDSMRSVKKAMHAMHHLGQMLSVEEESDEEVDGEDGGQGDDGVQREENPDEKSEEDKKKEEEHLKELESIDVKSGDYQVIVHIIEVRELKAENLDGTSDPVVFVEVFKQKRNTITVKGVTSAVYDEVFIFNVKNIDKEALEKEVIRISCRDSSPMVKGAMIGAYAFDAMTVYTMNKDHEMYRTWVPLMDDEDPQDVGVQGYMKLSVQIIGPGEKVKIHDEAADRAAERAKEASAGSDLGSMLMLTPTIVTEWKYLRVRIYRAEGFPVMDGKVSLGVLTASEAGVDAVVGVTFGGGSMVSTPAKTVKGATRALLNPYFNYELWYPFSVPTMTQVIKLGFYDKDSTGLELIGQVIERLNNVKRAPQQSLPVMWYNVYGAPEFKTEGVMTNISDSISKKAKQNLAGEINWHEYYNNSPEKSSSYKGRVLVQISVVDKAPKKKNSKENDEVKPFRRKIKQSLSAKMEPRCVEYIFQAIIFCGAELPSFKSIFSEQFKIRISLGIHDLCTKAVKLDNGVCRWNEILRSDPISLPTDTQQLPDLFVYLLREDGKPVCFKRMPVVRKESGGKGVFMMGFEEPASWVLLQEDKSIDALNKNVFPGKILCKLGFGLAEEANNEATQIAWKHSLEQSRKNTPYQLRVHVFQGKDLPAADSNGLCDPYVKVSFMGQVQKTHHKKKTVYPCFYQTLTYQNIALPDADDFVYAPMLCLRLYDRDDYDEDDYLGTCFFHLKDAFISDEESPDANKDLSSSEPTIESVLQKDPTWLKFFYEVPGDSQGEILVAVQLIPTFGKMVAKPPKDEFTIQSRDAFIEFLVIGMRDMAPYMMQPIQNPFINIDLNSCGSRFTTDTKKSKEPEPMNPNYLQRIVMPVKLPVNSLFTTPLLLKAKDSRLGGYLKPTVGVCQIDMSTKLPWDLDKYVPPCTDVFKTEDKKEDDEANETKVDEYEDGVTSQPVYLDKYLDGLMKEKDTGAGIFGAIQHIDQAMFRKGGKSKPEIAFGSANDDEDEDAPPKWKEKRKVLETTLEEELITKPFESYKLMRGQANGMLGSTLKCVGYVKGIVRVVEDKDHLDKFPLLDQKRMDELLKPKKYVIRIYALNAVSLAAKDVDIFGNPSNSDPYIKVSLGGRTFNDRENAVNDVSEVDLFKVITMETELPGVSRLNIDIMDKDLIGYDDLIGRSVVDLEDRWFDGRWQEWGQENMVLTKGDPVKGLDVRWKTKPIEKRTLYHPAEGETSQGELQCYIDIMSPEEALAFPPDDVALPPRQIFEVRVVVWKTKNVPPMDIEGMSDLFVKIWPEGCQPQETDTHWRCKKGKASFNWRMLFDVELGHNTRAMKFPYLHIQLWDRDLLKWNDCAGEGIIDLGKFYRSAYRNNSAIKLFEKKNKKGGKKDKKAMKQKSSRGEGLVDDGEDIPPAEGDDDADRDAYAKEVLNFGARDYEYSDTVAAAPPPLPEKFVNPAALLPQRADIDSDDEDDDEDEDDYARGGGRGAGSGAGVSSPSQPRTRKQYKMVKAVPPKKGKGSKKVAVPKKKEVDKQPEEEAKEGGGGGRFGWGSKKKDEEDEEEPLLESSNKDNQETKDMVTTIKNMTGLWDIDPEDSSWMHIVSKDKNHPEQVIPMGSICYSVQIWPKEKALAMPVGAARTSPNTNPFLPPPTGRMQFSLNPFVMGSELCGPVLCAKIFCCMLCVAFCFLMIFFQPFLNIIINLIFVIY